MATQFQNIEQEMKGLATELATLRLPHKLNQYRVYERKLRSVEKQIKEVAESDDNLQKRLEAELTQLQSTLDRAVLCGVSQCFICGGNNSDLQLGSPKKFPITTVAYSRSVSAHANYANNQQRGKLPFENGSSRNSNRQYGTQISYHGKVGNNVAEKGVSSPPPPPPDIVPTLLPSPQQQHPTVTSSPSPSLSPSRSLTPSPSPSPTPSSPAPTASPLQFEGDEKEKETSNDTSAAKEVVIPLENGKSSNENIGKGTAVEVVLSTPEKTTTTTTTTTTTKISTPPASPKIARTASPSKPSTPPPPPPPPPLSPKPQRRSPSPSNFVKDASPATPAAATAVNGSVKRAPEKPSLPPPPPPPSVSPTPTVRPKSAAAVSGTTTTAATTSSATSNTSSNKPSIFSVAPFRSTASSYRAYKDFISSYTTGNK